jgi:hypothetical protein
MAEANNVANKYAARKMFNKRSGHLIRPRGPCNPGFNAQRGYCSSVANFSTDAVISAVIAFTCCC